MDGMARCPACGQDNPTGSTFCRKCGGALAPAAGSPAPPYVDDEPVEVAGGRISWGWVAGGTVMIIVLQIIVGISLFPIIVRKMVLETPDPSPYAALGVIFAIGAAVYFACGMVVGRLSKGYTVKEPAIASVAAAVINMIISEAQGGSGLSGGPGGLVASLFIFALLAGLGAFGGWLGEKLQARSSGAARTTPPA
jgi:hypothetical protein